METDGWSLLGYEAIDGRHADYSPGSADLPLVAAALTELQGITAPANIEIKDAADRWAPYAPPDTLRHFAGDALLHTDFAPDNVLITQGRARLVDWAWPTRGAARIDPGALALRLMDAGHSAEQAIAFAGCFPSWRDAAPEALAAFGAATATLWREIAEQHSDEWKQGWLSTRQSWSECSARTCRHMLRAGSLIAPCSRLHDGRSVLFTLRSGPSLGGVARLVRDERPRDRCVLGNEIGLVSVGVGVLGEDGGGRPGEGCCSGPSQGRC